MCINQQPWVIILYIIAFAIGVSAFMLVVDYYGFWTASFGFHITRDNMLSDLLMLVAYHP